MLDLKSVRKVINADSIGKNKAGNIVFRRGYFYRNGMDSEKFANFIMTKLNEFSIDAKIVNHGDVWKQFRGGASVANSSHFFVEIAAK
jgi:hypothetical protein